MSKPRYDFAVLRERYSDDVVVLALIDEIERLDIALAHGGYVTPAGYIDVDVTSYSSPSGLREWVRVKRT